ncbi:DUF3139 domain-containing protein [Falsibacillus albus]|uniref:DUF3139 domain-containing protein n=1 Tax=Falsibacillus albus TaxID=2478915 RepID=A0A3L7JVH7_9BACI|nr:DUF3139 domain-containing protein [Falsibacillus albus]RLQ94540.1 DUF3139 domain-containing protein [Falsibacillus albus]
MEHNQVISKKMKFIAVGMIVLLLLTILVPLGLFGLYKYNAHALKRDTFDHLSNEGYSRNEIRNVEVVFKEGALLSTLVEFVDEPHVQYWYDEREGQIVQIGTYDSNGLNEMKLRHLE